MLLPYLLTDGAISDDDAGIAESGNGIPDIIDEARYEVDFWLRLRDGDGYSHGLTNPNGSNELFQAGPTAIAAWANAANAAMLADAFRIAGQTALDEPVPRRRRSRPTTTPTASPTRCSTRRRTSATRPSGAATSR